MCMFWILMWEQNRSSFEGGELSDQAIKSSFMYIFLEEYVVYINQIFIHVYLFRGVCSVHI